ncbi:MAG: monovalent cation/H+ antiporter subunit D family protein [Alphaproteobacteria bacterium]|nr:monovalent cation/H+ antiporter subunit D family protein [Alphaproteobacteria bacterium]
MFTNLTAPFLGTPTGDLIIAAIAIPFIASLIIPLFYKFPNLREAVTLIAATLLAGVTWSLYPTVAAGGQPELLVWSVAPGLDLAFKIEPLGMLFGLIASTLWVVNSIYSIGYMRGNDEPRQTQFYVCFAVAISATMALAFSANLFTMFLAYEVLTLSTYPLVTHKATEDAMKAGRVYLVLLVGTSMVLFLPAILLTWATAGTLDFTPGGIIKPDALSPLLMGGLLALFIFGIGKAAVMPIHFWLPAAMVAPTPVSALLHAVAVVKAGVFTVLKVIVYVFGIETLTSTTANEWVVYLASFCVLMASIVAMNQDNLKARLAYSTVSQLSYIVLGAALATAASITGGALHILMHAFAKITLFFCAGAIYITHRKTEVSQLDGLGRLMPLTMFAFLIGSLSIIGIPPLGGTWSKWYLALGALDANYQFAVAVFMISSLLNIAYLVPIVARAFFKPLPGVAPGEKVKIAEAPIACLIAISITMLGCFVTFFYADPILDMISLIDFTGSETNTTAIEPSGSTIATPDTTAAGTTGETPKGAINVR